MKFPVTLAAAVLSFSAPAFAVDLDDLVRIEQSRVDNESVSVYGGTVGKAQAIFAIEWTGTGNPVSGYYYYVSKPKTVYTLTGTNPKDGVILLAEYTPQPNGQAIATANCVLTKRTANGRIYWEGTMNNTDGRKFPMSFSRKR